MSALLWLCVLPIIGLGAVPLLGGWVAFLLALALLPVLVALCGWLFVSPVVRRAARDVSGNTCFRGIGWRP